MPALPPVVELRQYTLHPGRRDDLITLFEREFVESQQACGMQLLGTFRDMADADRFVWLRGFAGMPQRAEALGAFYGGPVWQAHRDAANATMIDSDDVLLLRPCVPVPAAPPVWGTSRVIGVVCPLRAPADDALRRHLAGVVLPALAASGAKPLGMFETEPAENTFPRLPVRQGEHVVCWFASVPDARPTVDAGALLDRWLSDLLQTLTLLPTARSAWR
jgi:hypothetical protein